MLSLLDHFFLFIRASSKFAAAVIRARAFANGRAKPKGKIPLDPLIANSPSIKKAIAGMMSERGATREEAEDALMRAQNFHELLTREEIAERLKVPASWVYEKTRKRSVIQPSQRASRRKTRMHILSTRLKQ